MSDINVLLVSAYLEYVLECDMVEVRVPMNGTSECVDVIGVNSKTWDVYLCEVEKHLLTGKSLFGTQQTDVVYRSVNKFRYIVPFVRDRYEGFTPTFMFWVPIVVEHQNEFVRSPVQDLNEIVTLIDIECGVKVQPIANDRYAFSLKELRHALAQTKRILKSPVLKFIQMEEQLRQLMDQTNHRSAEIVDMEESPSIENSNPVIPIPSESR